MVGFDCVKTRTLAYVQSFRLITYHCSVFKDLYQSTHSFVEVFHQLATLLFYQVKLITSSTFFNFLEVFYTYHLSCVLMTCISIA